MNVRFFNINFYVLKTIMKKMKKTPHQLTDDVKLLQKVALIHNDKILILQREDNVSSRPLSWDLPGGNSEWPETLENKENLHRKDAAREVLEESGIEIALDKFSMENLVSLKTFFEAQKQIFTVILGWKIDLEDGFLEENIKISHEHINFEWITLSELDDYDFGGSKGEFIKEIIRSSFGKIHE